MKGSVPKPAQDQFERFGIVQPSLTFRRERRHVCSMAALLVPRVHASSVLAFCPLLLDFNVWGITGHVMHSEVEARPVSMRVRSFTWQFFCALRRT
jgi:hypothetical protein